MSGGVLRVDIEKSGVTLSENGQVTECRIRLEDQKLIHARNVQYFGLIIEKRWQHVLGN